MNTLWAGSQEEAFGYGALSIKLYNRGECLSALTKRIIKNRLFLMLVSFPFWQHENTGLKLSFMNVLEVGSHRT